MVAPYPASVSAGQVMSASELAVQMQRYRIAAWTGLGALYGDAAMRAAARRRVKAILGPRADRLRFLRPAQVHLARRLMGAWGARRWPGLASQLAKLEETFLILNGKPSEAALPLAYWRSGQRRAGEAANPATEGAGLIWYAPLVPMRGDDAHALVGLVEQIAPQYGIEPLVTLTALSDRCFDATVPILFDRGAADAQRAARACYTALAAAGRALGYVPYRLGVHAQRDLWETPGTARDVLSRIKAGLDPQDIITPGRYIPPLA
jgi:hypothetical protein